MSTPKPPPGHFTLLYFAAASSFTHRQHDFLPAPVHLDQLFGLLEEKYPGIREKVLESCAVTVNLDYVVVGEERAKGEVGLRLKEGDEVAIIPPVSSG